MPRPIGRYGSVVSDNPTGVLAGRYRLVRPRGEGGMGRVWQARDPLLGREVAVKEIAPAGLTAAELGDLRERAIREARAIAAINHPNVVRIFDVVQEHGAPWIVMELVRSRSLHDAILADGPMAPGDAAQVGLDVLAGLRAAHQAGILHRDVKPGNVLLAHDGRVVLTDFGLASVAGDSAMTHTGVLLGSPAFLAPERARDQAADAGSDLWSLGATLYTAVEGRPPYVKSSPMATLAALMVEEPRPARRAGVLGPALEGLLRKDPADRVGAEEAEHLLRAAASGQLPVRASQGSRPRWPIVVSVILLVLAGGLAIRPLLDDTGNGAIASALVPPSAQPTSRLSAPVPPTRSASASPSVSARTTSKPAPTATASVRAKATTARPRVIARAVVNAGTGTCLDVPDSGGDVQLWPCQGTDNQQFSFATDGTVRALGKCLRINGDDDGAHLAAAACTGEAAEKFTLNASAALVSTKTDKCVDVPGDSGGAAGVPVQIFSCNGTSNQRWRY
jgi:serine/threonine protein kinase